MFGPTKRNPNLIVFQEGSDCHNPKKMLHPQIIIISVKLLCTVKVNGTVTSLFLSCSCTVNSPPLSSNVQWVRFLTTVSKGNTMIIFQLESCLQYVLPLDRMTVQMGVEPMMEFLDS